VIEVTRVDYIRVPVDDIGDPAGNRILLRHRFEPYEH
jgi:hypothetical protein